MHPFARAPAAGPLSPAGNRRTGSPQGRPPAIVALGFLLSIGSAGCFGLYVLPRRRSPLDAWAYTAAMGGAVAALGALLWCGLAITGHGRMGPGALSRCTLSGAVWFVANTAYTGAIDRIGVARASAMKNLTALFGTVFGLLLTGERLGPAQGAEALAGSALIVAAALLIGGARGGAGMPGAQARARRLDPLGVVLGLVAAAGIGYYLVPAIPVLHASRLGWLQYQAVLGVSGGLLSLLPHAVRRLRGRAAPLAAAQDRLPAAAGGLWFLGSLLVTPGTTLLGLAIAWPLSQLSFYLTLGFGVAVFHEIDLARSRPSVWIGGACTLAALALFGLARG